jgi:DNA-binding GntR family transcriptional regulator
VIRKFSAQEIGDLYDLRVALESYAAAQAASRISPEALERLETACEGVEHIAEELKKTGQGELDADMLAEMSQLDMEFHLTILRATSNRMLLKSAHESRLMSRIFGISRVPSFDWDHVHGVYRYHRDIFEAIKRGDTESSRAAMARHINFGKEGCLKFIAEHQANQEREAFESVADQMLEGSKF